MTSRDGALLVVALVVPVVGFRILGYLATQGNKRADSILRWSTLPIYIVAGLSWAIQLKWSDPSEVWSGIGLLVLLLSFAAIAVSRSFNRQLGLRRVLLVRRNAYAGQTVAAFLCAVQAANYRRPDYDVDIHPFADAHNQC